MSVVFDPTWIGLDASAFTAGLGIVAYVAAFLFVFLIGFWMVRRLLQAAGLL